jgi:ferrous iron transport protein A
MKNDNTAVMYNPNLIVSRPRSTGSGHVIPLSMVRRGEKVRVKSISGKDETRRFLSNIGFVEDAEVSVVSEMNGNVIVNVKGTRVAISKSMASRVLTA